MAEGHRLSILISVLLIASAFYLPPASAISVAPGVVFRPSNSSGNLSFAAAQTFSTINVDSTGVTFDGVRIGFMKLPAGFPGLDVLITTWSPLQTVAAATSIGFTGVAPSGSSAYLNVSNLIPFWEYDFYVDGSLQAVQFSTFQGNVSFAWSLWSSHGFRIALGSRSAGPPPLTATFSWVPASPGVGQPVYFAGAAAGGTPPYAFSWDFGDGGTAYGSSVTHRFPSALTYAVRLSVTDASGQLTTLGRIIAISPVPAPQVLTAAFGFTPSNPSAQQAISFAGTAAFGTPPYTFSWSFGDGFGNSGNATVHAYSLPGLYNVTLNVTDSGGGSAGVAHALTVTAGPPPFLVANITADFSYEIQGTTVSFADRSRSSAGLPIVVRIWVFGDGGRSEGSAPVHTYEVTGFWTTYRAILVACDASNHCGSTFRDLAFMNWGLLVLLVILLLGITLAAIIAVGRRRKRRRKAESGRTQQRPPPGEQG